MTKCKKCGHKYAHAKPAVAQLVFSDPPYGISYRGNVADAIRGVKPQSKSDLIKNDTMAGSVLIEFLGKVLQNAACHSTKNAAIYLFFAGTRYSETEAAFHKGGWRIKQQINWIKSMVIGRSDYHYAHEPILYGAKLGTNSQWFGDRCETTIFETTAEDLAKLTKDQAISLLQSLKQQTTAWEEKKDPPSIIQHPNQKPVSLAGRALRNSSLPGHHVLDPFAGSGSTLIAAELHDRHALTIDLSRGHVDAILRRFAETFENVTIKRNGKAFDPAKVHAEK